MELQARIGNSNSYSSKVPQESFRVVRLTDELSLLLPSFFPHSYFYFIARLGLRPFSLSLSLRSTLVPTVSKPGREIMMVAA